MLIISQWSSIFSILWKSFNRYRTKKEEESKEENDEGDDEIKEEDSEEENGSKKDGLKSYFESSIGDDSDKSSFEESDVKNGSNINNSNINSGKHLKNSSSIGKRRSILKKIGINEMNNINENSEESYDSSCDTIKDEFEPTKLNTNIKENSKVRKSLKVTNIVKALEEIYKKDKENDENNN